MPIINDPNDSEFTLGGGGEDQAQQTANQSLPPAVPRELRMFPTLPANDPQNYFGTALMGFGNPIGDAINSATYLSKFAGLDHTVDPNFDVSKAMSANPAYEQYDQLATARNQNEFDLMKQKIDQENADKATIASGGTLKQIAAGALDPIYYLPVVGEVAGAARFGKVGAAVLNTGAHMGVASTLSSGINYATNLTPTLGDETRQIAATTVLGSVLGGAHAALGEALGAGAVKYGDKVLKTPQEVADSIADASRRYADNVTANDRGGAIDPNGLMNEPERSSANSDTLADRPMFGDVGAMQAGPRTSLEQEALVPANIVPNRLAEALPEGIANKLDLTKSLSFNDPLLDLMNSPNIETRRAVQLLSDIPADVMKNQQGIASAIPAESVMKQWEGEVMRTNLTVHDLYTQYRFGAEARPEGAKFGDTLRQIPDLFRKPADGKMTFSDFRNAVGDAMTRGDKSPIPEVQAAAQAYRARIFDPLKDWAIRSGQLPVDVKPETAPSYLTRLYNREKIIAERPNFERILTSWLKSTNTNISERFDNYIKQAENSERLVKEFTQKGDETRRLISEFTPMNRESIKNFNILQREMKVLAKQHDRLQRYADKAQERVKNMTPAEANAEFKKAINHVKNGIPKNQKAKTLSEWVRSNGGLLDDEGGEVRAAGGGGKDARLINNKSGMTLEDAAQRAQEAGYFPDHNDRPTIRDFLDALQGDAQGSVPRYSDFDHENIAYEEYIDQLGKELDQRGIDVDKLTPGQIENILRSEAPGAADTIGQRAKMREAEYAQRRADQALKSIKDEIKRRQLRFDDIRVKRDETSAKLNSAKAELEDIERVISANNEKATRWRALAKDVHYIASADDAELASLASDITDGLIGIAPGRSAYKGVPVNRGPLKERTLLIPDEMIKDYLDRDVFRIGRHYQHSMTSDLAVSDRFGRADMKPAFDKINDQYGVMRQQLAEKYGISTMRLEDGNFKANTDNVDVPPELSKELQALNDRQKHDIDTLSGLRDRLRGTYGGMSNPYSLAMRSYRVIKTLNYMRSLGMQALTAISHAAKPVAVHGVMRIVGDGIVPLVKNMKQFALAADEAKLANTGLEMASNATQLALAGLDDNWMRTSRFERGLGGLSDNFRFLTLMSPFIASMKQFTAVVSQTRSLEAIETLVKGGENAPAELARLAKYGIDRDMAARIWQEVDQHGTKTDDVWWANTAAWQDKAAAEVYRTALQREVDRIIVTPGQDIPLFMSRPMGAMLLQFRSFAVASIQRTLISGLQQRDMAVLNGFLCATALGMFSYWAKTPSDKLSDDPKAWIAEGIDRAGALGWFDDANNALEKLSGNTLGLRPALGLVDPKHQKYDESQAASAVLGPTYSTVFSTFLPLMNDAREGTFNQKDLHELRQMLPYQNLFYMRKLFDTAEEGVNNSLNIPKKHKQ
jgi:hypothetical protein